MLDEDCVLNGKHPFIPQEEKEGCMWWYIGQYACCLLHKKPSGIEWVINNSVWEKFEINVTLNMSRTNYVGKKKKKQAYKDTKQTNEKPKHLNYKFH